MAKLKQITLIYDDGTINIYNVEKNKWHKENIENVNEIQDFVMGQDILEG